MSSPREAVYDVLLSQKARAAAAEQRAAAEAAEDSDWAEYEQRNLVANSAYRGGRS